jgi:hypothetical protein
MKSLFSFVPLLIALVVSGCASAAQRHPLLDPVGVRASFALDALTIAEDASKALKAQVDSGTLKMGQTIADTLNVLSAVGDACKDIGVLLDAYNKAASGAGKIKAAADLNGKVAALDTLVAQMPTANIEQAVKDLASKVKQMKGGIQ